eukprot:m.48686 g.48686  ORF g.48686 m.48686 type:complete len:374 (+) comp7021_c0_seq1:107-1228(+)
MSAAPASAGKRITVLESDGSESDDSGDDAPPPLEDMSDSLWFRKKYTERKRPQVKRSTPAATTANTTATGGDASSGPDNATTEDKGAFAPHTNVTLHGLSAAKYNGCHGVVRGYDATTGRHEVKLDSGGKTLKVKPANLKKSETFSGLGKGFFARASSKEPSSGKKTSKGNNNDNDDIEVIAPKKPGERPGEFAEVQEAMSKAAPFLEQHKDEWCTPDLLEKIESVPGMAEMMENPMFANALIEFQANPAAAMQKYGGNPKVTQFFQSFLGIMGNHLSGLADKEPAGGKTASSQGRTPSTLAPAPPQPDPDVAAALARPGVREALEDPRIKTMIDSLRRFPHKSGEITAAIRSVPELAAKLKTLCDAGVLGIQ